MIYLSHSFLHLCESFPSCLVFPKAFIRRGGEIAGSGMVVMQKLLLDREVKYHDLHIGIQSFADDTRRKLCPVQIFPRAFLHITIEYSLCVNPGLKFSAVIVSTSLSFLFSIKIFRYRGPVWHYQMNLLLDSWGTVSKLYHFFLSSNFVDRLRVDHDLDFEKRESSTLLPEQVPKYRCNYQPIM